MTCTPRSPQDKRATPVPASPAPGSVDGKPPAGTVSREPADMNQEKDPGMNATAATIGTAPSCGAPDLTDHATLWATYRRVKAVMFPDPTPEEFREGVETARVIIRDGAL